MENMHAEEMTAECEKHLLETHYFVTRDIRLDAQLFAACKDEAVNRCNLKDNWSPEKKDMAPESGPMTFACLYRHALGLGPDKTGVRTRCPFCDSCPKLLYFPVVRTMSRSSKGYAASKSDCNGHSTGS